jgi:hypothetical protein
MVSACGRLNMTSTIDPSRRSYFCVGNGSFSRIALAGSYAAKNLKGIGCSDLIAATAPGFDFDSSLRRMVGWAGGDMIYVYDPDTDSCSAQGFSGGPGRPQQNGTFGRFRYFPALGVFALVNDWKQNAYTLRLQSSSH